MINTNLKCLITLPSSAILFSGGDALFFQRAQPLSILGKNSFCFIYLFRGMPVAGHGKVSPDFLYLCRRKTANLLDK